MPSAATRCASKPARAGPVQDGVIPRLRWRDAHAAIDWLCTAVGFERHTVHRDDQDKAIHAQRVFGNGMVMRDRLTRRPDEIGGTETQSASLVVPAPDALYARAKAVGAKIPLDIQDEDHGGRGFTSAAPEGHI